MARDILSPEADEMFRVRVSILDDQDQLIRTEYQGPYSRIGTAKAQKTRINRTGRYPGMSYREAEVERAEISIWLPA